MAMWPEPTDRRPGEPSDAERDRMVALLRLHCTEGRISLDEFSDRVGLVYAADTQVELDRIVHDLPVPDWARNRPDLAEIAPKTAVPKRRIRWMVSVFGDSLRRGRFALDEESAAVAVFGSAVVDLTDAHVEAPETVVTAVAVFGDVTILVPDGIDVMLEGVAVFGDRKCQLGSATPLPGSPSVVVRAYACFGDVVVRSASEQKRRRGRRASRR